MFVAGDSWLVGGERGELVSEAAKAGCFVWLVSVADDESRSPTRAARGTYIADKVAMSRTQHRHITNPVSGLHVGVGGDASGPPKYG